MLRSLRMSQIRLTSRLLEVWGKTPTGRAAIVKLRRWKYLHSFARFLVGYRRTFASFAEAERCSSHFSLARHEHPDNITDHLRLADYEPRESDYPVLFFMEPLAERLGTVFDLGGSVGNVFYALQKELALRADLTWKVYDLPPARTAGLTLAREKNEPRIHFADTLEAASGCDLFLASGSLHYFETPIAEMLASLARLPGRLIINRTPCLRKDAGTADDLITVHDHGAYLLPTKVHSIPKLVESLRSLGYTLRASWPVHERHQWIPLYPDLSSVHYSGFYFVQEELPESSRHRT